MKIRSCLLAVVGVSLSAGIGGLVGGCGTSSDPLSNDNVSAAMLEADQAVLDNMTMNYAQARRTKSAMEARADLVTALQNTAGVAEARLFKDGHTVFVKFTDGFSGGINTVEGFGQKYEGYTTGIPATGATSKAAKCVGNDLLRSPASDQAWKKVFKAGDKVKIPRSKKTLFMGAGHEDFSDLDTNAARTGVFDILKDVLTGKGWSDGDVDIKYNKAEDNYSTLRFEDFFNLKDYGIIIIFAHGSVDWNETEPGNPLSPVEKYYFIQVTGFDVFNSYHPMDSHDAFVAQYGAGEFDLMDEMKKGRILLLHHVSTDPTAKHSVSYFYMREDLWQERMNGDLPDSFVYLLSCYGWNGQDSFAARKAGNFLGWDNVVTTNPGVKAAEILYFMAGKNMSDLEGFNENGILKQSVYLETDKDNKTMQYVANLHLWPDTGSLYAPAWADVSTLNPPTGTRTVLVRVAYTDTTLPAPNPGQVQDIASSVKNFVDLVPGQEVTFSVQALDGTGKVLGETKMTTKLNAGKNTVALDFKMIYAEDFEDGTVGPEWSIPRTATAASGRKFLGPFVGDKWTNKDDVWIRLNNLPTHSRVTVSFDLLIMGSWDGNQDTDPLATKPGTGPDQFGMGYLAPDGLRMLLLNTSFATTGGDCQVQCYPGSWPGGDNPANTGAIEVNTLGGSSAVYRITKDFQHFGDNVTLFFEADGRYTTGSSDDTYGIDNIQIGLK
jgi:hypothetical protein